MGKIADVREVPLDKLVPYERNAKIHGSGQIEKLKKSIQEFGFLTPCLIDSDYNLIAGHGRVMAARELGIKKVPCVFIEGLTDSERKAYILAENKLAEFSAWDMDKVEEELQALFEEDFDISLTGFEFDPDIPKNDDWFDRQDRNDTSREEGNDEYNEFLDKFETKKTTDDCYTPQCVFDAVAEWVAKEYNLDKSKFIRPFYPGGDYQSEKYPKGCAVVDNPPFSILAEILQFYCDLEIPFFLFAPTLTLFSGRGLDISYLPAGCPVTYENGAVVNTSFITNMETELKIRTVPDLHEIVKKANEENVREQKKSVPKYEYPAELVTAASLSRYSVHGVEFSVKKNECERVTELDAMKEYGKAIFGGGFLLSEQATKRNIEANRQKAENVKNSELQRLSIAIEGGAKVNPEGLIVWELSDREKEIIKNLG